MNREHILTIGMLALIGLFGWLTYLGNGSVMHDLALALISGYMGYLKAPNELPHVSKPPEGATGTSTVQVTQTETIAPPSSK